MTHDSTRGMRRKYTKELLEPLVRDSVSIAEVIKKLGVKWSGGTQQNIVRWIKRYNLDTSHMLGQRANSGESHRGGPDKRHWTTILIKEERDWREKPYVLRRALIESGRTYECEGCGCNGCWYGKHLKLQVNHKNGDWGDNRSDNLQFLCPNCHACTEGWSGDQGMTEVTTARYQSRKRRLVRVAELADARS